mgnify:CR=1 FL=1
MALFLDCAEPESIRAAMALGIYAGVTTNPKLLENIPPADLLEHLGEIARCCRRTLYFQAHGQSADEMERHALLLFEVAPGRTVIKLPMGREGMTACQALRARGVPVCLTALFSPLQVAAAALAGAHSAALYVGRVSARGEDGIAAARRSRAILSALGSSTRLLCASVKDAPTLQALLEIADADVTIPPALQEDLLSHPGTAEAIEAFRISIPRRG